MRTVPPTEEDLMNTQTTIGVIGATGKTGRRIADRLERGGYPVRRLARGSAPAFDWTHPQGWSAALDGIGRLYIAYEIGRAHV